MHYYALHKDLDLLQFQPLWLPGIPLSCNKSTSLIRTYSCISTMCAFAPVMNLVLWTGTQSGLRSCLTNLVMISKQWNLMKLVCHLATATTLVFVVATLCVVHEYIVIRVNSGRKSFWFCTFVRSNKKLVEHSCVMYTAEEGLQDALEQVSGLSTVPNVYIGKDHLLPFSYVVVTLVVFCSKP